MLTAIILVVIISMGMILMRVFLGSSVFDRILAANSFGTHIIIFIVLLGMFGNIEFFIDVALVYGLINFVSTIAFLMYFKYRPEK